jgi:thioesterase domain-containing protein
VVLFQAIDSPLSITYSFDPPEVQWGRLVNGELVIYNIPGNHTGILEEPNVQFLAEKLTGCVDKALVELL